MSCRVLVVDDSRSMRALIAETLRRDPRIEVVGEAADPLAARDAIKEFNPDVVTLDIEMPKMNGLEFLDRLMRLRPTRVIVISSLTERGAATTIRAMEIGAMECIAKPSPKDRTSFDDLAQKVVQIGAAPKPMGPPVRSRTDDNGAGDRAYSPDGRIVAIGASMGGVDALFTVLSALPANCPPTVVVQHMPALFTQSFAARLDRACKASVAEAKDGDPLEVGRVLIAPGGSTHLELVKRGGRTNCRLVEGDTVSGHRPSVDVLFRSAARVSGSNTVGVILTGMGRDGAEGLLELRNAGASTIGQDEATCIVYGMPRAAYEIGAVETQLPLQKIGPRIIAATSAAKARVSCP